MREYSLALSDLQALMALLRTQQLGGKEKGKGKDKGHGEGSSRGGADLKDVKERVAKMEQHLQRQIDGSIDCYALL